MPSRLIIAISLFVAVIGRAAPLPENSAWHPKLVYRQIGGGFLLAREIGRKDGTFFVCRPSKVDCIGTKELGWRKPFIIYRSGGLGTRSYQVIDTTGMKHPESAKFLENVPRYPAAVAWEKLSATRPMW
jgi:hypothetical protein